MEFDSTKSTSQQLQSFTQRVDSNGNFIASVFFYGNDCEWKKPKLDDKKKISFKVMKELCCQSVGIGQVESLEAMYTSAKQILEDDTISKEEKFNILFGDIELLFHAATTDFKKRHDKNSNTIGDTSIMGIRETHKVEI